MRAALWWSIVLANSNSSIGSIINNYNPEAVKLVFPVSTTSIFPACKTRISSLHMHLKNLHLKKTGTESTCGNQKLQSDQEIRKSMS